MGNVDRLRSELTLLQRRLGDASTEDLLWVNEELRGINANLTARNRTLIRLNDELANLLDSTAMPILMVDRDLRIRRVTPAARSPFSLRASDLGRPITELQSFFGEIDIESLIRRVIRTAAPEDVELLDGDRHSQLLRVRPYPVGAVRVRGATLALIDLDPVRRFKVAAALVESAPIPMLVLDGEMRVKVASEDFLAAWGFAAAAVENKSLDEIDAAPFCLPEFKRALKPLPIGGAVSEEITFGQDAPDAAKRTVLITARATQATDRRFLIAIREITGEKYAQEMMMRALDETDEVLRVSQREFRALAGRLLQTQDEERRRISRELHDDLSQDVAALQFDVEALAKTLPSALKSEKQNLATIGDSVKRISLALRRIAHELHPSTLQVLGLAAALRTYAREFSRRTGIAVYFTPTSVPAEIPSEIANSFYRIAQEALRNVARHAAGSAASILLTGENSRLSLSICDTGPGFDREAVRGRGGLGLVSMEERARLIRARFQIESIAGKGVSITVSAALEEKP